jgi:hypothetical protein
MTESMCRGVVVAVLLATGAASAQNRIYRRADGTACVISVGADGKLVETCEEARAAPVAAPTIEPAPPRLTPTSAALADHEPGLSAVQIELIDSAAVKRGWSGALKLGAISSAFSGLLYLGLGVPDAGLIQLAGAGLSLAIALIVDGSAAGDIERASGSRR